MKRIIIYILVIAFVLLCHYWTYRTAYIEGYKQAIKDEIEYIQSQTDFIKGEIRLLDRAIKTQNLWNGYPLTAIRAVLQQRNAWMRYLV